MGDNNIIVNQIGYMKEQDKRVLFKNGKAGGIFKVINLESNQIVYEGKIIKEEYSKAAEEHMGIGYFSELKVEGTYQIVANQDETSYPFKIGDNIYKDVFRDAVRFFYLQRCGEDIPKVYGREWAHPICHTKLAKIYGSEKYIDVSGGWHDAGDFGRYIVATSKAVADLMLAYKENPKVFDVDFNVPRKEQSLPYILEEIKGQIVWMFKMQDVVSGGVYHKVTCAKFPSYDTMPQEEKDELIVCPISTAATGTFAAVMAMAYECFNGLDKILARRCLDASKKAWDYLAKAPSQNFRNPEGIVTGEYGGESDLEERYWAVAQLFKATGEKRYKVVAERFALMEDKLLTREEEKREAQLQPKMNFSYDWSGTGAYGDKAYLEAVHADKKVCEVIKNRIKERAKYLLDLAQTDGYGIDASEYIYIWGSNMYILMLGIFLKDAYEIEEKEIYRQQAREYLNYCFGMNPLNLCYVTGYGSSYPKHPHHRIAIAQGVTAAGMLVGGANRGKQDEVAKECLKDFPPAKSYIDKSESFSTNEVDIYWNSVLVWALVTFKMV